MKHGLLTLVTAMLVMVPGTAFSADEPVFVDPDTARWQVEHIDASFSTFYFGLPGDTPLIGDWDCDGRDSAGMWRPDTGFMYLQDDDTGVASERLFLGQPGHVPLAGDWNGDGCDTVGIYAPLTGRVWLSNDLEPGFDIFYYFGVPGDKPFVGDFDEDGVDELGLHRESTGLVYLRMDHSTGVADSEFYFGVAGDRIVAGDWDQDGDDTVAVFRPDAGKFYLQNENATAFADAFYPYPHPDAIAVAGNIQEFVLPPPPPARTFTLAASGDFLIHSAVYRAAEDYAGGDGFDFSPMLEPIAPLVEAADFAICHLEVPLSPDSTNLSSYPQFNAPAELADAIAGAGYDSCSVASNHTIDKGETGVRNTLAVLDAAGIQHAGAARGPEEDVPELYTINGVTVGHLSYTYGLNGLRIPAGKDYLVNVTGVDQILADAAAARAAGAEFVVVSMHWGSEYVVDPTSTQRQQAETILSSPDVDFILGHHAHVVQPIGQVGNKYVVYGMGNFLSNQRSGNVRVGTEDGVLIQARVWEQADGSFSVSYIDYTPTYVEEGTFRILPVPQTLNNPSVATGPAAALETSWERTQERINRLGTPGVRPTETPG
ncbi:MAG: CapA family protein [Acidimicrobiia bacterium]|nr:CapA family protein [Acidimicrobiia bacterium]NNF11009.1 CapA family protein [Acidimicrobiia bacterium]NNL68845.1 CapA family protein [Acidimicrobiia bacterium]